MKILLTGSTGFLGQNLEPLLKKSYHVTGIGSKDCNLTDQASCKSLISNTKPDVIIHAAGSVGGIQANKENPGKFMYENLIMGTNLIHEAMLQNISKFILLGTICSYPKFTPVPFKEEEIWSGYPEETNAPYGIAKKTLMTMIKAYNKQYNFNGVNLVPVNMYGPHDHFNLTSSHVIPALILKFHNAIKNKQEQVTIWGNGQASREFLYVEDCCRAIELAVHINTGPDPINIGTGIEIKICDLAKMIAEQIGFKGQIIYDTSKPNGQPRRCLEISRAKERLGFESKISLKTGLKNTIEWFKEKL